jgi:hypothetical protein
MRVAITSSSPIYLLTCLFKQLCVTGTGKAHNRTGSGTGQRAGMPMLNCIETKEDRRQEKARNMCLAGRRELFWDASAALRRCHAVLLLSREWQRERERAILPCLSCLSALNTLLGTLAIKSVPYMPNQNTCKPPNRTPDSMSAS